MNKLKAIIFGATGLIGSQLVEFLENDPRFSEIVLVSRKSMKKSSSKIKEIITDYDNLDDITEQLIGDCMFCCIGTTSSKTKSKDTYKKIDGFYPIKIAEIAERNNIPYYSVVSSIGANASSKTFYLRTKGEMEIDVLQKNINSIAIVRPSILAGKRNEFRFGEKIGLILSYLIYPFLLGALKKYRLIKAKDVAASMLHYFFRNDNKRLIYESDELVVAAHLYFEDLK